MAIPRAQPRRRNRAISAASSKHSDGSFLSSVTSICSGRWVRVHAAGERGKVSGVRTDQRRVEMHRPYTHTHTHISHITHSINWHMRVCTCMPCIHTHVSMPAGVTLRHHSPQPSGLQGRQGGPGVPQPTGYGPGNTQARKHIP